MQTSFVFQALPTRVVFGRDTAATLPAEADRLALVQLCHTLLNTSEFLSVE